MKKLKVILIISIILNVFLIYQFTSKIKFGKYYEYYVNKNKYFEKSNDPERAEIFKVLPIEKNAIVFAGDSHVENFELTELLGKDIKNRGVRGENIEGLISRLNTVTINEPNKIFLEIGINDLAYGDSKEKVIDNYRKLIQILKKSCPNSKIYVISIFRTLPGIERNITYCNKNINEEVKFVNASLAKLSGISFIDCYNRFSEKELSSDGIHLSAHGYLLWSSILKKYL